MAKDNPSKKYPGVYYRELLNGDRSYFIITRLNGRQKRISIGKKSEGITEAFCNQEKNRIKNAARFGDDTAALLGRVKKDEPTFTDLAAHYIAHGSARATTKRIIKSLAVTVPFNQSRRVTEADITAWLADIITSAAPATVNSKITLLRVIFKHAADHKLIQYADPTAAIKKPRANNARTRWLTRDEVAQLLDAVRDNPNLYLFVKLAVTTGARISTLLRLHAQDINGQALRFYNVKLDRFYTGYTDGETAELLRQRQQQGAGYVLAWGDPNTPPTARWYQVQISEVLNRLFNNDLRNPLDKVVIHTLRHTAASLLVQNGTPLHIVQKVLDHSSINSTERYAKIAQDAVREAVANLWT